ncbi:hypothetical protein LCGC14_0163750 [marine sediment metagenome]|uniref:ParB/Sulfiredoxin domain-containing protein n=1 Tax=marine sediment metagenome TaxID=412755 RepID=A0A0F9XCK9_9ZZZZ
MLTEADPLKDWEREVVDEARAAGIDLTAELVEEDPRQILTYELHQDPEKIAALRQAKDIPPIWIACGKLLDGHHRLIARMMSGARSIMAYEVPCDTYEWLQDREFADLEVVEFIEKLRAM